MADENGLIHYTQNAKDEKNNADILNQGSTVHGCQS